MTTKKKKISVETIFRSRTTELGRRAIEFVDWLKVKNYSPQTVNMRMRCLHYFLDWAEERDIIWVSDVNGQIVEHYEKHLLHLRNAKGEALSAINRYAYLTAVSKFCSWLMRQDFLPSNPATRIVYPKIRKNLPKNIIGHKQIEELLMQPDVSTRLGIRDRAILEFLYSTGIRRAEAISLNLEDIDMENRLAYIRQGKGNKMRVVPVGERALQWLEKYLAEVRPHFLKEAILSTLFVTRSGRQLLPYSLGVRIKKYLRACGQSGGCHIFRHAMATEMLNHGADLRYIQEILGHENICTTQIYTHTSIEKIKEVYDKTHPFGKSGDPQMERTETKAMKPTPRQPAPSAQNLWPENQITRWMQEYLTSLRLDNHRDQTLESYSYALKCFALWCQGKGINDLQAIDHGLLETYHKHLAGKETRGRPVGIKHVHAMLASVCRWCRFLADRKALPVNVAQKIELPRTKRNIPCQVLNEQEVARILSQPDVKKGTDLRDRAVLELLYATGIRWQELQGLEVKDINFEEGTLFIRHGKGGRERIVPVTASALAWVEKYLLWVRPVLCRDETEKALFLGNTGNVLHSDSLDKKIKRYARDAGVIKPVSCHRFRHAMATALLDNGADIRTVQEILGHRSLSSTQIYTKVAIRRLREVHDRTHPARSKPSPNRNENN